MASPFRFFRKHQKGFMAAAVVLCMVIFVFASALDPSGVPPAGQRADSAEVATWNGGSISEGELRNLVIQRRIVNEFLRRLWGEGQRALGREQMPNVPSFIFDPQSMSLEDLELRVINNEVAASLAEEAGMTVSDEVINNYLREWGLRQVDGQGILGIMRNVGRGDTAQNEAIIFETLRKLLLAHYYDSANFDASATVTPLQRWNDWRELNQRVSVQAAVLPVADFIAETPEPTEAQLLALYDQFQDQPPGQYVSVELRQLPSPDPGFAEPQRVQLQYLRGSVADWAERLRDTVTEEEIVAYYEANKRQQFVEMDLEDDGIDVDFDDLNSIGDDPEGMDAGETDPSDSGPPPEDQAPAADPSEATASDSEQLGADAADPSASEADSTDAAAGDDASAGEGAAETAAPEQQSPAVDETTGSTEAPNASGESGASADEPADPTADDGASQPAESNNEAQGDESAAEEQTEADEQPESSEESDGDEASSVDDSDDDAASRSSAASPFRLANYQADDESAENAPTSDDASAEESVAEAEAASSEQADQSAADTELEADGDSSDAPAEPVDGSEAASDDADQEASPQDSEADDQQEAERYTPLDEVRETIRDRLAEDKAFEQLPRRMNEALIDVQSAYSAYANAVIDAREKAEQAGDEQFTPPDPPKALTDLQPYAERHDLIAENTGQFTYRQLLTETLVGPARNAQTSEETVAQAVFGNDLKLYEPYLARDLSGDWYLVQKTEVTPYRIPDFEQVRAEVLEAWKLKEAAKLAEARAKELANQLNESGQSFDEFFESKGYEVVQQTELFSRKTLGLVGGGGTQWPMISTVTGLNNVGPELLDAIFQSQDDEAVGGLNFDQTEAYVVQIRSREMTDEELRELFLITSRSWLGRDQTTQLHRLEFDQARMQELQQRVDLNLQGWRESREERLRERS